MTCIHEALDSNLGMDTDNSEVFMVFLSPSSHTSGYYLKFGHDCFMQHHFRFTIDCCAIIRHLVVWDTDSVFKSNVKACYLCFSLLSSWAIARFAFHAGTSGSGGSIATSGQSFLICVKCSIDRSVIELELMRASCLAHQWDFYATHSFPIWAQSDTYTYADISSLL
jgi:hypothetical protein